MRMTSRLWYLTALLALLLGAAGAVAVIWNGISGIGSGLTRIVVPGTAELTFDAPGSYTVFHEPESVVDGKLYSAASVDGLRVAIVAAEGGEKLAVTSPGGSTRYSVGGHSGVSVLAFDIPRAGRYRLVAAYDGGRTTPVTVLAVGRNFVGRLVLTILTAVGCVFAGFGTALTVTLITYFQRRRMRRAAESAAAPGMR